MLHRAFVDSFGKLVAVFALVLALGGTGTALAGKPTIGILGLEVIDDGSGIDAKTTQFSKELTEELRKRPKAGTGPFALAAGSDKDLLEMKLLSGCENEGKDCMAAIGAEIPTDRLLYGKVEKRKNGYQVSLKLLVVDTKAFERSISDIVPLDEATGASLTSWGKKLYAKLTGVTDQGNLVIKANVERGTVYLDGQVKGNLTNSTARIAGLSEGKYALAIEAEGHLRFEASIEITPGEDTEFEADLEKNAIKGGDKGGKGGKGTGPGGSTIVTGTVSTDENPGGGYRALFWTSLVATGAAATGMTVFGLKVRGSDQDAKDDSIRSWQDNTGMQLDLDDACADASDRLGGTTVEDRPGLEDVDDACATGKRHALLSNVFVGATAITAVAAVFFYYKGFIASKSSSEGAANATVTSRKKKHRPTVVAAPIVSPTSLGAGVRVDF